MCVSTISRKSCWKKFCTSNQGRHYVVWTPVGTKVFLVERDGSYIELLLNYLYKLIHFVHVCVAFWHLIVVIILLCHYLVLIYVHFHISHVISWSSHGDGHCRLLAGVTSLNQEFFRIHFTRPRNIAKSLKYCCPICLMSSGGNLEPYFSTSLTLVLLVDWRESTRSLSPAIFSRNGPSSAKVSSLPITSYLTGQGWQIFCIDAKDDRAIYY